MRCWDLLNPFLPGKLKAEIEQEHQEFTRSLMSDGENEKRAEIKALIPLIRKYTELLKSA